MAAFLQDLRFVSRQLRFRPGFTATVLLMLALGIGSSLAIFAFVDASLLKPMPFRDPNRLNWTTELVDGMGPANLSWLDYQDWNAAARSFKSLAVWRNAGYLMGSGSAIQSVPAMQVSANFLHTLGVVPQLGRDFEGSDNLPNAASVAMLTDETWHLSGRDPNIIGQSIRLDGEPVTVIGVLPKNFTFSPRGTISLMTATHPDRGALQGRRDFHHVRRLSGDHSAKRNST